MTGDRVSYTLESTLESVNWAEQAAEQFAARFGLQDDDRQEFAMAVREAAINAVLHGNAYDRRKTIEVTFAREPETLEVTVRDQGKGFDVAGIPDPLAPENLLKQSGRGIFLIRTYMDEVRFRKLNPGTEMVLVKRIRGKSADKEKGQS
jgi:serine/threonine-protein kinase RsbW